MQDFHTATSSRGTNPDPTVGVNAKPPSGTSSTPRTIEKSLKSCSPKQASRPQSYRLSRELDELLRWEGLGRSRNSRDQYSFRHEDIVEMLEYTEGVDDDSNQANGLDADFGDSMAYSEMNDILASARQKLDLLEGNLKGARHSLLVAPSLPSPVSTGSSTSETSTTSKASLSTCSAGDEDYGPTQGLHATSAPAPLVAYSSSRTNAGNGRFFSDTFNPIKNGLMQGSKIFDRVPSRDGDTKQPAHNARQGVNRCDYMTNDSIPPIWSLSRHARKTSSAGSSLRLLGSSHHNLSARTVSNPVSACQPNGKSNNAPTPPQRNDANIFVSSGRPSSDLTPPPPLTPHENRADAFDYQNYLLRTDLTSFNPRRPSSSSAHSSATARGPNTTSSGPSEKQSLENNRDHRESYSTADLSTTTTDTESLTADDWDSDSDVSEDQDLDELLHEDLDCKWPVPPAFTKKPTAAPKMQPPPPLPSPQTPSMPLPTTAQPQAPFRIPHPPPHHSAHASTSTTTSSSSTTAAKSLGPADQVLLLALSEAMRDACLRLRDGPVEEQVAWRMRIEDARRVLLGEGC